MRAFIPLKLRGFNHLTFFPQVRQAQVLNTRLLFVERLAFTIFTFDMRFAFFVEVETIRQLAALAVNSRNGGGAVSLSIGGKGE